ncbi:MAG: electron transport complex subunit E [Gammaproteobacteria bacterium]|nr:electron transport complex subunit E [Gammaproteobacteria bacterium]
MTTNTYPAIAKDGLWHNNPALVQILGLCPLLATSNSAANGLGLGLATLLVLTGSNLSISLLRKLVPHEIRIPVFIMLIASYVTNVQTVMNAFAYPLYQVLGIFIPLIVTNCVVIGRAEAFASKQPVLASGLDGFAQGMGFCAALFTLGALRELAGQGTLLADADKLLGPWARVLSVQVFHPDAVFLAAILPPGAFIGLGVLIAGKNWLDARRAARQTLAAPASAPALH